MSLIVFKHLSSHHEVEFSKPAIWCSLLIALLNILVSAFSWLLSTSSNTSHNSCAEYRLDEVDNNHENADSRKFNMAINKLHQMAGLLNSTSLCEDACLETIRDIIIQLKLISWGYFGAAGSTAGIFLAYNREHIGSYFANSENNQWPFHPLHKEPSVLEVQFNNYLMQLTEKLSNGTSKASILDMAAFGSSHLSLNSLKTRESNWPLEVDFAVHETEKNLTVLFSQYKKLMFLWDILNVEK